MKDGLPFHGTKSDILNSILPKCVGEALPDSVEDQEDDSFDIHIDIVDLYIQIRAKASVRDSLDKSMTYCQLCLSIINGALNSAKSVGAKRLDLVADQCCPPPPRRVFFKRRRREFYLGVKQREIENLSETNRLT